MPTDRDIEQFISDSFSSVWDIELLGALVGSSEPKASAETLMTRMRASELIVEQGIRVLVSAGIISLDDDRTLSFSPANKQIEACALAALAFYQRYPGRVRRLLIARQSPGLTAFADAFRVRKDPS